MTFLIASLMTFLIATFLIASLMTFLIASLMTFLIASLMTFLIADHRHTQPHVVTIAEWSAHSSAVCCPLQVMSTADDRR